MTVQKPRLRRFTAALGAVSLAAAGILATGAPAMADVGPDQPGAPTSGTLTINKYSGAPVAEGQSPHPDNLLDGVEFTVSPVGVLNDADQCVAVDLTEAADWDGLEGLFNSAPAAPVDPYCLVQDNEPAKKTVDGQAVFNLDVGIYFVQETDPGEHNIVSPVPNFYVSIPTSNGKDGDGWNYKVVADPKNQLMEAPTKTIEGDQTDLIIGSDVTWNLSVPVPTLNNDEKFTEAVVTDVLDERLKYVIGSTEATVGGTELRDGEHFEVTGNAVWTFNDAGRAILDDNFGEDLLISFKTTVLSVGDGAIPNDEYSSTFNGTKVPGTPKPYTYWGQLSILKTDNSSPALNLAGAEFQVFNLVGDTCEATAPATGAIAIGTSNDTGIVQWNHTNPASSPLGLWIANVDNGPADPSPSKDYCVYETVVPAGHTAELINNPVKIFAGEITSPNLTVVNAKTEGPDLPLTGAQGTLVLTVGGLAIVALGTGLIIAVRRHQSKQDA